MTIEIVNRRGSSASKRRQTTVPALALFNASSDHSWISQRFAEKLDLIRSGKNAKREGQPFNKSVKLAWRSKDLGPYVQSTVFMIAPYANFDVLFSELRDENKGPSDQKLFRRGVQRGLLKKLVDNGAALRVVQDPFTNTNSNPVMPSLAQLEARLVKDPESHQSYHEMSASNIRSIHGLQDCQCSALLDGMTESERTSPTVGFSGSNVPHTCGNDLLSHGSCEVENYDSAYRFELQSSSKKHSGHQAVHHIPDTKDGPANLNSNPSNHYTRSHKKTSSFGWESVDSGFHGEMLPQSSYDNISLSTHTVHHERQSKIPPTQRRGSSLELRGRAGADAEIPLTTTAPDDSKIIKPPSLGEPIDDDSSIHSIMCRGGTRRQNTQDTHIADEREFLKPYSLHKRRKTTKRNFKPYSTVFKLIMSGGTKEDTFDSEAFDPDYWKWDGAEKQYYHIDQRSNEKLWYEPPP